MLVSAIQQSDSDIYIFIYFYIYGFSWWLSAKKSACNARDFQETQVWSLGQEDPLEKEMATHSSIPAWETPWTGKPGRAIVHGHKKLIKTEQHTTTKIHINTHIYMYVWNTYLYRCMYAYTYTYMHTYIYINIRIHIHTYIFFIFVSFIGYCKVLNIVPYGGSYFEGILFRKNILCILISATLLVFFISNIVFFLFTQSQSWSIISLSSCKGYYPKVQ